MSRSLLCLILALAATTLAAAQDATRPESSITPPGTFNFYYGIKQPFKITIESENGLVSVLEIPRGVFLNVQAREDLNPTFRDDTPGPRTFRGEVVLRLRRSDEWAFKEGTAAHEVMASSPMEVQLKNVVVVVETL